MQIPFSLSVLGLGRGPMQSLRLFYSVVKKLAHLKDEMFDQKVCYSLIWAKMTLMVKHFVFKML